MNTRWLAASFLWLVILLSMPPVAFAQPAIPQFTDTERKLSRPDVSDLNRLRFLTTTDFFPFNFLDSGGRLSGFHVDLARAICRELNVLERCQIQALPFDELETALDNGQGDAIMAGLAITSETREKFTFTHTYLQFPARFVARKDTVLAEPVYESIPDKRIGVMDETIHETMLRAFFPDAQVVTYSRTEWLLGDVKEGRIAAAFGDGMRFAFWLAGTASEDCCSFFGGPYLAPEYLGHGMAIAVSPDRPSLADALNYALQQIEAKGTFQELYLRYFPVSFY